MKSECIKLDILVSDRTAGCPGRAQQPDERCPGSRGDHLDSVCRHFFRRELPWSLVDGGIMFIERIGLTKMRTVESMTYGAS
jgi:hypothetical protein